ncbi:MAG: WYL domain-containing protein [Paludibacteraceae bacterium]|nr:WYL domain-containing protein [Paludibacteraceae bacterium]
MPIDKNKLLRYKVLDRCFANQHREFFIEDLQKECENALNDVGLQFPRVSVRTIINDINEMESNRDWNVDLLPKEQSRIGKRRFYRYADPNYSIWKSDLNEEQLNQLKSILLMLRQFDNMPQYYAIEDIINQLEAKYKFKLGETTELVSFETNDNIEAMHWFGEIFTYITAKQPIEITYQPFGKEERSQIVHPYYLKQYNRRWFLFGLFDNGEHPCLNNYALDRIISIRPMHVNYIPCDYSMTEFFEDLIGVTNSKLPATKIVLEFSFDRFPYVLSKPIHPSQIVLDRGKGWIQIEVKPTKELYQQLLSFGDDVEIISPAEIRQEMMTKIAQMQKKYFPL